MLKKILFALGLAKAPAPVKSYVAVSSVFGAVPALAWVAWRNRDTIRGALGRLRQRSGAALPASSAA